MRLRCLNLERYGPFTDRTVTFRRDARLHVVIGPNEAGKTSALAAVTDLLFGIEHRTRHAYLHDMSVLRLGAEIEAADGTRFAFRRRKGLRNTLVDADDAAMPDDVLAPFLKGLTREVFCRAFGLDADALRAGGREMMDVNGEVGASLFAAGSGLRGYTALQTGLDEEAQRIFAPRRAKDRLFYQALDRYDEARKTIRQTELREGAWRELNDEVAGSGAKLDAIRGTRERIAAERARLERLKRVAPLIAAIDEAEMRASEDGALITAGDAGIDRLGDALEQLRAAGAEQARVEAASATARADLDALPPRSALIDLADAILDRFRGIDQFEKEGTDLPRVQGEIASLDAELDRLATRVGLPDRAALVRMQPSDAHRARLNGLIREGRDLASVVERARHDLAAARAEHEALQREQTRDGQPLDPTPLREALRSFAPLRKDVADRAELEATIQRAANVLRGQAARMMPPVSDVAALAAAPLPSVESVARFRSAFDEVERERTLAKQRCRNAAAAVAAAKDRLREREGGQPIASRADLADARARREDAFAGLREALSSGVRRPASEIAAYERAVDETDRLADALAADAVRVAGQAADRKRLEADEAGAAEAGEALAEIEGRHAELLAAWADAWRATAIAPAPASEMAAWRDVADRLIEAQDDLDARRVDARMIAQRIGTARPALDALGQQIGLSGSGDVEAGLLLDRIEERIAAIGRRWDATRDNGARIAAAAEAIGRQEKILSDAGARKQAWRAQWQSALPAIGLAEDSRLDEADAALAAWRDVPSILRERDHAERRVRGMQRDREAFAGDVARLAAAAPDLASTAPGAVIRTLHARLQAAQAEETRRAELVRRRSEAERRSELARRARDEAQAALADHLATLGAGIDGEALAEVETLHARLVRRRALLGELAGRRAELVRAADGLSEAALRAELAATSIAATEADLANLAAEQEANEQDGRIAFADRQDADRRRSELEAGTGAELAHAQRKAAEAELAQHARQWAVLRLAHLMLGTAIGRYRAGRQDPLLACASDLFAALTGGAFAGLSQDYGESDEPRIVGRRPSGETVPVEGLSEGTRDQLYFALRLAYLRDYASRSEPAPFLGDDLFLTFDDARTAHGLDALATIGDSIQPILFTHHRHVADLAQARLGAAADIVEL